MSFIGMRFKLRAMENRHYWRLRSRSQRLGTSLSSAWIIMVSRIADFSALVRIVGRALTRSALLVAPPVLALAVTQSATLGAEDWPAWFAQLPFWIQDPLLWLASPTPKTFDSAALPSAAIQVAGVFVAVYFATVTFVISTTYKDATRKVRDQIVRQPESKWYAAFFSQAVVYLALVLGLALLDRTPSRLTLVVVGLSAALVVLSFGRVWISLFLLLEPTSLLRPLRRDLHRWVKRAEKLGNQENPSQVSVQRANAQIRNVLDTLNDLTTLILDREYERVGDRGISASHDPRIAATLRNMAFVWESYSQRKHVTRALPSWNPKRAQSKDWFLTSHSEVGVALATGTSLTHNEVLDDLWFERRLADLAERLLAGRDLRSVANVLTSTPAMSRALVGRGQFEELRLWLTSTTFPSMAKVGDYAKERGPIPITGVAGAAPGPRLSREQHLALPGEASAHNLVEQVMFEALSACLGHVDYFERMARMLPSLGSLVADDSQRLVAGRLPLEIARNLRAALATEIGMEGGRVTPDRAISQLMARALATEAVDEVEHFIEYLEREIWPWVAEIGNTQSWAAGSALSRATELTEKLGVLLRSQRQLLDTCESLHIERDDRWPATDTSAVGVKAKSLRELLELPVARLAATVESAPDTDRPDHFGWAYYRAHENVLARLLGGDPGDAAELRQKVGYLYLAGDVATQRLFATVRRHDQSVINSYVAEPYVRFLQLCGIALALSEVTEEQALFAPFETLWTSLFKTPELTTQLLGRAAATLSAESSVYALTPGGIERTDIEIRANQRLEELGVPRGLFDIAGFSYGGGVELPTLTTGANRVLRSVRSSHYEGMFYSRWLRPSALAAGGEAPTDLEHDLRSLDLDPGAEDD